MRIEEDLKLDFKDVLIRPKRSEARSRKDVVLKRKYTFRNGTTWVGTPIIAANMDGVGTFGMSKALMEHDLMTCLVKSYTVDDYISNHQAWSLRHSIISTGISNSDLRKVSDIINTSDAYASSFVCVDVANGYTEMFSDFIYELRCFHPELVIIAGNVVTGDMTQELLLNGADIIKCGIGPGSVCTTRIQTGVGYPQLSAVIECADAAHGLGGHIIADGGCTCSGDVAKAFGGGSDFVMLGGMLAGHDEGGGEVVDNMIKFYGMSSETANDKHFGGLKDYRASEGKEVSIPYKGDIASTIQAILGGIRSACTYIGAGKIKDLPKSTTFVRVNNTHNRVYGDI